MREINLAFETLRKAVPSYMPQLIFSGDGSNEKLTKISTLRLAMKYIKGLTELLHKDNGAYSNDDCSNDDMMESHSIIFRDTDTCTLTALNTSTCDHLNSPNYGNDGGSDGESLHSGHIMTSDNVIDISIETFSQADVNFDFSENFFNPELG
ncbi:uncharacterized protein LOC105685323 [Athalia rosae]|uniref:uncharacterized protein LOC105685323 n=1 Tax=Athalia rosae TaxID=37344 RepID=UPI0020344A82|nr:uncharacterized protein LOC105685323 [Athalia rosae]